MASPGRVDYRYSNPSTGKWLSRDPVGEQGGLNLYGFVGNAPVQRIDRLGTISMDPVDWFAGEVSDPEKQWCKNHRACCCFVRNSGENAKKEAHTRYPNLDDDTVENAVQHCAWMCYVASACSREAALELGIAHEDGQGDNNPHSRAMDLFNNAAGANLGTPGTLASLKTCFDNCEQKAKVHNLYWYKAVKNNSTSRGLPADFPGFQVDPSGGYVGPGVGTGSSEPPVFIQAHE